MPRARAHGNANGAATRLPRGSRAASRRPVPFPHKLVLYRSLLSLFNVERFEQLAEPLRNEALEGLDENKVHHFHHALTARFLNLTQLPTELLLEYDQNIVSHTLRLNERRITRGDEPVVWKYFQYLAFIVSNTPSHAMRLLWNMEKPEMERRHILFQEEDKDTYVRAMLSE